MTAPCCSLCAQQHRGPRPMHQTASGVWVCPICDRNIPPAPTGATHLSAHIIDPPTRKDH